MNYLHRPWEAELGDFGQALEPWASQHYEGDLGQLDWTGGADRVTARIRAALSSGMG